MIAEFHGECWDCGAPIVPGDVIERVPGSERLWQHQHCPDSPDVVADVAALTSPRCGRCGLNHPGQC